VPEAFLLVLLWQCSGSFLLVLLWQCSGIFIFSNSKDSNARYARVVYKFESSRIKEPEQEVFEQEASLRKTPGSLRDQ
jgi:hypothetical protein